MATNPRRQAKEKAQQYLALVPVDPMATEKQQARATRALAIDEQASNLPPLGSTNGVDLSEYNSPATPGTNPTEMAARNMRRQAIIQSA